MQGRIKFEDSEVTFSSGRVEYCFAGILGISEDGRVTYGYDGDFGNWDQDEMPKEDMRELAEHMIARWTKFRDSL